jgi:hypothetical protein
VEDLQRSDPIARPYVQTRVEEGAEDPDARGAEEPAVGVVVGEDFIH